MNKGIEHDAERAANQKFLQQNSVEQTMSVGISGPPQMRRGERSAFLGQFPEQVLKAAPARVLDGRTVPEELLAALRDKRAERVYINASVLSLAKPIIKIIKELGLGLTVVHSPEYKAGAAIVVGCADPVNEQNIWIEPRA